MSDHEHAPSSAGPRQIHYHHITVQPITPPEPLVVCSPGFVTQLAAVEHEIAGLEIVDETTLKQAAEIQNRITKAGKLLEDTRVKLKAPFLAKGREIDAAAAKPAERIEHAKASLSKKLVAFQQKQSAAAAEAERARQAELERLEKLRLAEIVENERKLAEIAAEAERNRAAQAPAAAAVEEIAVDFDELEVDFDDDTPPEKSETERKIEALRYAPAVATPAKAQGIRYVVKLVHTVVNPALLPDQFVIRTPKEPAIRATFCNGWKDGDPIPECPGVEFRVQRDAVATGQLTDF